MIAGFEHPTSGQVLFNGQDITTLPPHKRNINTVFQRYALFPHLNVFNNVAFGLKIKKVNKKEIEEKATERSANESINEKNNLEEKLFCQQCGEKLDDDSIFCVSCGTKVK